MLQNSSALRPLRNGNWARAEDSSGWRTQPYTMRTFRPSFPATCCHWSTHTPRCGEMVTASRVRPFRPEPATRPPQPLKGGLGLAAGYRSGSSALTGWAFGSAVEGAASHRHLEIQHHRHLEIQWLSMAGRRRRAVCPTGGGGQLLAARAVHHRARRPGAGRWTAVRDRRARHRPHRHERGRHARSRRGQAPPRGTAPLGCHRRRGHPEPGTILAEADHGED